MLKTFFPTISAIAVSLFVMWVKLRLDQLSARVDNFCNQVEAATDLAIDYWLAHVVDVPSDSPADKAAKYLAFSQSVRKSEVKLRAMQIRLSAGFQQLLRDSPDSSHSQLRPEFVNLLEALTGGSFGERTGEAEFSRADNTASAAARLVRFAREGRDAATSINHLMIGKPRRYSRIILQAANSWWSTLRAEMGRCRAPWGAPEP